MAACSAGVWFCMPSRDCTIAAVLAMTGVLFSGLVQPTCSVLELAGGPWADSSVAGQQRCHEFEEL
eukprot:6478222-Amphidinium_carterae.2